MISNGALTTTPLLPFVTTLWFRGGETEAQVVGGGDALGSQDLEVARVTTKALGQLRDDRHKFERHWREHRRNKRGPKGCGGSARNTSPRRSKER